jgi:hypothetical protein
LTVRGVFTRLPAFLVHPFSVLGSWSQIFVSTVPFIVLFVEENLIGGGQTPSTVSGCRLGLFDPTNNFTLIVV